MEAQVNIGVVAHSTRAATAKNLARSIGAQFISIDTGILGCDANHAVVQRHLAGMGGDWSVAIEDDAVPVDGFREQLAAALAAAPTPVVGLYLGRQRPPQYQRRVGLAIDRADLEGAHWIIGSRMLHAVGYAIRTELLPSLLAFDSDLPADEHIGAWARTLADAKAPIGHCWPSLVDHSDVPTVTAHPDGQPRTPGRVAWRVGTRTAWSSRSVALSA